MLHIHNVQLSAAYKNPKKNDTRYHQNNSLKVKVKSAIFYWSADLDAHLPFIGLELVVVRSLKSVMHGQCDARPTVTFPVAGCPRHWLIANYTLVDRGKGCQQLAHSRYRCHKSNPQALYRKSRAQPVAPLYQSGGENQRQQTASRLGFNSAFNKT